MLKSMAALALACTLLASCGAEEAAVPAGSTEATSTTGSADPGTPSSPQQASSTTSPDGEPDAAGEDQEPMDENTVGDGTVPATTEPASPASAGGSVVESAKADLSGRLSVPMGQITLVTYTDVVWRDGSLGCPEPGYAYTQALVEGYRIVLDVDGTLFEYHGAGTNPPKFCVDPAEPFKGGSGNPDA